MGHGHPALEMQGLPSRMKILITADLHYREHWLRWLLSRAANYDLICIAGDLLVKTSISDGDEATLTT
jgi:Icc-related predicted phosphoesterase